MTSENNRIMLLLKALGLGDPADGRWRDREYSYTLTKTADSSLQGLYRV
jgi:hypothetical protein